MTAAVVAELRRENERLQEENAFLRGELGHGVDLPTEWRLSKTERRYAACLYRRGMATPSMLLAAVYAASGRDEPDSNMVGIYILKLRRKLRPHGCGVITSWGVGYSLDEPARAAIRALNPPAGRFPAIPQPGENDHG